MRFSRIITIIMALGTMCGAGAAEPADYYVTCAGRHGADLLSALRAKVGPHTTVSYDGLWSLYLSSDALPNGKLWDIYSTKEWTPGKEQCGNYKNVGDCINREHSFPKSWFSGASPMYSDAYHLYPTDGKVNGQRSNYPYGECAGGTTLPSSNGIQALGRLGTSTFAGYTGKVFEPDDRYKGDLARSYFYMAAAYNDKIAGWSGDMLAGNAYPAFSGWAVDLLLKWHRQDPVSDKELDRNEAIYAAQKNRNPFIDHPELAEHIWGTRKDQPWSPGETSEPAILLPADGSTVDMGTVGVGVTRQHTVTLRGNALGQNVSLSATAPYSVSPATVTATTANRTAGTPVTVTLTAPGAGTCTGTLTVKSGDAVSRVTLTANALDGLPASAPTAISDVSFDAHWTYVGDADANGCYKLIIKDAAGQDVDSYPRSVKADAETWTVDDLEPSTTYTYWLESKSLRSNPITVSTAAPIPSVQILFDGDLGAALHTEPGIEGTAAELLLDIDNIDVPVTYSVAAPFELSGNNSDWSATLTLDPAQDRMYMRLGAAPAGVYTTTIHVAAGDYTNDDAMVTATVSSEPNFHEDFEVDGKQTGNYSTPSYAGNASKWLLSHAGVFRVKAEACTGEYYVRFDKSGERTLTMDQDKGDGVGTVTVQAAGWSPSDGAARYALEYSVDGGLTWTAAGEGSIETPASTTKTYQTHTFTVNRPGNVRLRLRQTYGQRMCLDDIKATAYRSGVEDAAAVFGDDRGTGWDARSIAGNLVIDTDRDTRAAVYSIEGQMVADAKITAGTHTLAVNPGLYIVVIGQASRRVMVK